MDVNKKRLEPNTTAVRFINFSDEEFIGRWDSVNYPFPAKSEIYVEAFKALHFCKHLVDREIQKLTKEKDGKQVPRTVNDPIRAELEAKALPDGITAPEPEKKGEGIGTDIVDPSQSAINKNAVKNEAEKPAPEQVQAEPPKQKSVGELRDIYESVHPEGKRPSPKWNADELEEKINTFKSGDLGEAEQGFEGT